jgi:transcriptional regulator with XRE-family HTH domain
MVLENVVEIPTEKIVVPEWRVRKEAEKPLSSFEELKTSISTHGLMQPIEVAPREDGSYELIFGLRRFEAVKELGWKTIPAIVRQRGEIERQMAEIAENVHRLPYGSKEKALAIAKYAKLAAILQGRTGRPILMTPEQIQRAKELQSKGIGLRKIARELGVSHETVRQYLKVHEAAPEAGVARETTSVKQVAKFSHPLDTGQTMGEQIPEVGEAQPVEKKPHPLGERGVARALAISHETVSRSLEVEKVIGRYPCLDRLSRVEDVLELNELASRIDASDEEVEGAVDLVVEHGVPSRVALRMQRLPKEMWKPFIDLCKKYPKPHRWLENAVLLVQRYPEKNLTPERAYDLASKMDFSFYVSLRNGEAFEALEKAAKNSHVTPQQYIALAALEKLKREGYLSDAVYLDAVNLVRLDISLHFIM